MPVLRGVGTVIRGSGFGRLSEGTEGFFVGSPSFSTPGRLGGGKSCCDDMEVVDVFFAKTGSLVGNREGRGRPEGLLATCAWSMAGDISVVLHRQPAY